MIRRLIYIATLTVLYALFSLSGGGEGVVSLSEGRELPQANLMQGYEQELLCALECNNDAWRSPHQLSVQQSSVVRTLQQRHRVSFASKMIPHIPLESRAGHATHIFDYNHFRSSLRVGYYLYALCRLRI